MPVALRRAGVVGPWLACGRGEVAAEGREAAEAGQGGERGEARGERWEAGSFLSQAGIVAFGLSTPGVLATFCGSCERYDDNPCLTEEQGVEAQRG